MLRLMSDLLEAARRGSYAVPAFSCYDLETASTVSSVAAEMRRPVMYLISAAAFKAPGGEDLLSTLLTVADHSPTPACVQLDHCDDLALIRRAIALGAMSVMADGSKLPLEDNVGLVRAVARLTGPEGAEIEAELGHVSGNEEVAVAADAEALTDPQMVAPFVDATGAQCLAVSLGNVHGTYRSPPKLDLARLEAIESRTTVPLALHGASGLRDQDVRRAIAGGVTKVNVNTDLRRAYIDATVRTASEALDGFRLLALHEWQREALSAVVREKLVLCS